jgi:iron(III) transport system permease protein
VRKYVSEALCWALIAVLGLLLVLPILKVCVAGVRLEGEWNVFFFLNAFRREIYRDGLLTSLGVAGAVTLLCLVIGLVLAFITTKFDFAGKNILTALLFAPIILPPFVGAIGLRRILAMDGGCLNLILGKLALIDPASPPNWLGDHVFWMVVLLEAMHLYPIMLLNAQASIANVDPALEEAARNLGARPWQVFARVTLPLAMPGLFAGGTIVFVWSFTELGTPLMFDWTEVTPVQIFRGLQSIDMKPQPYVLVLLMLALSAAVYLAGRGLFGKAIDIYGAKGGGAVTMRRLGKKGSAAVAALLLLVIGVSLLPHVSVILTSLSESWHGTILPARLTMRHHAQVLHDEMAFPAVMNSMKYASLSVLLDLAIGIPAAYLIVRSSARGRKLLDTLCMLPLAVPGIVMAFGYLAMTRPGQPFAFLDPKTSDPTALITIAYAVRRLPFIVRGCAAGIQQVSVSFEEAARNLGAGPLRTVWKITLPLITANIVAASVLVFSFAMLEVSDSLILAYWQQDYPITKAIWELSFQIFSGENIASALGIWGMLLLLGTLLVSWRLMGRRLAAIFRA